MVNEVVHTDQGRGSVSIGDLHLGFATEIYLQAQCFFLVRIFRVLQREQKIRPGRFVIAAYRFRRLNSGRPNMRISAPEPDQGND